MRIHVRAITRTAGIAALAGVMTFMLAPLANAQGHGSVQIGVGGAPYYPPPPVVYAPPPPAVYAPRVVAPVVVAPAPYPSAYYYGRPAPAGYYWQPGYYVSKKGKGHGHGNQRWVPGQWIGGPYYGGNYGYGYGNVNQAYGVRNRAVARRR